MQTLSFHSTSHYSDEDFRMGEEYEEGREETIQDLVSLGLTTEDILCGLQFAGYGFESAEDYVIDLKY